MEYCKYAQLIIARHGDLAVKNGIPTLLYWHIFQCDICAQLRQAELDKYKK